MRVHDGNAEYRQALSDLADLRDEIEKSTVKEGTHFITPYTKIKTVHYIFMNIWKNLSVRRKKNLRNSETSSFGDSVLFIPVAIYLNAPFPEYLEELMLYAMFSDQQIMDFFRGTDGAAGGLSNFKLIRLVSLTSGNAFKPLKRGTGESRRARKSGIS